MAILKLIDAIIIIALIFTIIFCVGAAWNDLQGKVETSILGKPRPYPNPNCDCYVICKMKNYVQVCTNWRCPGCRDDVEPLPTFTPRPTPTELVISPTINPYPQPTENQTPYP